MSSLIYLSLFFHSVQFIQGNSYRNSSIPVPLHDLITSSSWVIRYSDPEVDFECTVSGESEAEESSLTDEVSLWTDGFYLQLDESFTNDEAFLIYSALVDLADILCIGFFVWPPHSLPTGDFVFIRKDPSTGLCYSPVGRKGDMQIINLGMERCLHTDVIIHEAMHSLGLYHEQSRIDRDQHITIFWDNIVKGKEYNFYKHEDAFTYGVQYNSASIMHYYSAAFAVNRTQPTILTKNGTWIGRNRELASSDIQKLQLMYKCK